MPATLDEMIVKLVGDGSSYFNMLKQATDHTGTAAAGILGHSNAVGTFATSLAGYARNAINALTPLIGVTLSLAGAFSAVKLAGQKETNQIDFGIMLRDVQKGKDMVKDIQVLAAATPMSMKQLERAAMSLLVANVPGERLLTTLKQVGEIAGADTEKFQNMAEAFGQLHSGGHLDGNIRSRMMTAGFDPLREMAQNRVGRHPDNPEIEQQEMNRLEKQMHNGIITSEKVLESVKRATSVGGLYYQRLEKQSVSLTGLFSTMLDDIDAVLAPVGESIVKLFGLKELEKEVSSMAQAVTGWFEGMSEGTKQVTAAILVAIVAVGGLILVGWGLWAVITMIFGGLNLWTMIAVALFGVLVGGTAGIIVDLGGVVATMEAVKKAGLAAWEWLKPVRQAVSSLVSTISRNLATMWEDIKAYAIKTWNDILGKTETTWKDIQKASQDAVLFMEFYLSNFKQVNAAVWAYVEYLAVRSFNTIIWWYTVVMPAAMWHYYTTMYKIWQAIITLDQDTLAIILDNMMTQLFGQDWVKAWEPLQKSTGEALKNMFYMFVDFNNAVVKLLTGQSIEELIFRAKNPGMAKALDSVKGQLKQLPELTDDISKQGFKGFKIPERQIGEVERQIKAEYDKQKATLKQSFEEFRAQKLKEFGLEAWADPLKKAEDLGDKLYNSINKPAAPDHKDGAKVGSAEAKQRLEDYTQRLKDGLAKVPVQGPGRFDGAKAMDAEARERIQDEKNKHKEQDPLPTLKKIEENTKIQNAKPTLNVGITNLP